MPMTNETMAGPLSEATAGRRRARLGLYCLLAAKLHAGAAGAAPIDAERLGELIGTVGTELCEAVAAARTVAALVAAEPVRGGGADGDAFVRRAAGTPS